MEGIRRKLRTIQGTGAEDRRCRGRISHHGQPTRRRSAPYGIWMLRRKTAYFTGRMSSNQAYYVQGWVIGAIAIAYLKVRGSGLILPVQEQEILPWIVKVVATDNGLLRHEAAERTQVTPKTTICFGLAWRYRLQASPPTIASCSTGAWMLITSAWRRSNLMGRSRSR